MNLHIGLFAQSAGVLDEFLKVYKSVAVIGLDSQLFDGHLAGTAALRAWMGSHIFT